MKNLLIVYASRTGNTEAMAKAVQEGALSAGASVNLKKATEATMDDLLSCDGCIFGTPTNFGYMAGTLKEFLDQIYVNLRNTEANKPYATFGTGDVGAKPTLASIDNICQDFGRFGKFNFTKAAEGIPAKGQPSTEILQQCNELGKKMAQL